MLQICLLYTNLVYYTRIILANALWIWYNKVANKLQLNIDMPLYDCTSFEGSVFIFLDKNTMLYCYLQLCVIVHIVRL